MREKSGNYYIKLLVLNFDVFAILTYLYHLVKREIGSSGLPFWQNLSLQMFWYFSVIDTGQKENIFPVQTSVLNIVENPDFLIWFWFFFYLILGLVIFPGFLGFLLGVVEGFSLYDLVQSLKHFYSSKLHIFTYFLHCGVEEDSSC